jgi:hypothetical protein
VFGDLHYEDGHEDADEDGEEVVAGHEKVDSEPNFEADHQGGAEDVENADDQQPGLQFHPINNNTPP